MIGDRGKCEKYLCISSPGGLFFLCITCLIEIYSYFCRSILSCVERSFVLFFIENGYLLHSIIKIR
nr:MAG TPA: hypothetical protein [Caudoviricetes sp.]